VNRIRAEFENQWQMDTSTAGTPVQFLVEFTEVLNLSNWIQNAIRTHIAMSTQLKTRM
jgi:hypothetical protein